VRPPLCDLRATSVSCDLRATSVGSCDLRCQIDLRATSLCNFSSCNVRVSKRNPAGVASTSAPESRRRPHLLQVLSHFTFETC
jgi:hypothetical protein